MSSILEVKAKILEILGSAPAMYGVLVKGEFEKEKKLPQTKPLIIVGIDKVELEPVGLGGYLGVAGENSRWGGWGKITLGFDCYSGIDATVSTTEIFERLCTALIESEAGVTEVCSQGTSAVKNGFGSVLKATAVVNTAVSTETPRRSINEIKLKRRGADE